VRESTEVTGRVTQISDGNIADSRQHLRPRPAYGSILARISIVAKKPKYSRHQPAEFVAGGRLI
jgi:hypothetical protein